MQPGYQQVALPRIMAVSADWRTRQHCRTRSGEAAARTALKHVQQGIPEQLEHVENRETI
jgi:hypothetical protein